MSNDQIKILGINVSSLSFKEVLESIEKYLQKLVTRNSKLETDGRKPLVIFTPNPEITVYAQKDHEFKKIVNAAQINIPDGFGLIWASRVLGQPLKEKIGGTDLMEKLVELAAEKGLTVGLIGGQEGIAVKALECLRQKYPDLKGWAEEGPRIEMGNGKDGFLRNREVGNRNGKPEVGISPQFIPLQHPASHIPPLVSLIKKIQQTKVSFLFVGLGCPKQEYFIDNLVSVMLNSVQHPLVLMAVGGSFDYLSGNVPRAPLFIRLIGFEWLFRLLRQPWRLRRQLALVKFVWLVLKNKNV